MRTSQKARAKSQNRDDERDREIESEIERTAVRTVDDESGEDAEAGASGTARLAAVADCGQPGDGCFWRSPGDAIGDS